MSTILDMIALAAGIMTLIIIAKVIIITFVRAIKRSYRYYIENGERIAYMFTYWIIAALKGFTNIYSGNIHTNQEKK